MSLDFALIDGRIWTEDPEQPEAEAVGVVGNRIAQVGNTAEIRKQCSAKTRIVELKGRRVVPGFNDAHVHLYLGGASLNSIQLQDADSLEELRDRVKKFASTRPKGEWILLGSWDPERWPGGTLPDRGLIDDVTRDHPVFINRVDAHTSLANTLALQMAGVDGGVVDPPGGEIGRRSDGSLTGIFKDAAQALISRVIPPPTKGQMVTALQAAQTHAARFGVTSVQDMGLLGRQALTCSADLFRAYQELENRGDLQLRVALATPLSSWRKLADLGISAGFGSDRLRLGGVKVFADGSLGSSTAWFFEPYSDAPSNCGLPSDDMSDPGRMLEELLACDRAGLQLIVHAIGDRANNQVLNFFDHIAKTNGKRDRRCRIEHAQHLRPSDFKYFADAGVIASVQPYHLSDDGRWAEGRIGIERAQHTYAFRSFLDAGVTLALGSDWWVAPINPLYSIWAATTRQTLDGSHPRGWFPEQKITVQEAVHGYTVAAAYASGEEKIKGSIERGKLADLAVLSDDIFHMEPQHIREVRVECTVFDGRVIYEKT